MAPPVTSSAPGRRVPPELLLLLNSPTLPSFHPDAPLQGPYRDDPDTDTRDVEFGRFRSQYYRPSERNLLWSIIGGKRCEALGSVEPLSLSNPNLGLGRRRRCTRCQGVSILMVAVSLLSILIFFLIPPNVDLEDPLAKGARLGLYGDEVLSSPAEITRGVQPHRCHSHNDYWRSVPLFEALHYGCIGVEADIWHFAYDDKVYVGHDTRSLRPSRTLATMYVDPLMTILDRRREEKSRQQRSGIFAEDPSQTLALLVDFKTDGGAMWPHFMEALEPLRERKYLTHYDGAKVVEGPITVVATGYAPFDLITANSSYRDVFFDAPLSLLTGKLFSGLPTADFLSAMTWIWANMLTSHKVENTKGMQYVDAETFTTANSYYASASFIQSFGLPWLGRLSKPQEQDLKKQIQSARDRGLKVRYWSTPDWPKSWRDRLRKTILRAGADLLNMDDLEEASGIEWTTD